MKMTNFVSTTVPTLVALATAQACIAAGTPETHHFEPQTKEAAIRLEFRIVANETDDQKAYQAVRAHFAEVARDPKRKEELDKRARHGEPPPAPLSAEGKTFSTPLGQFTYAWFELTPQMARDLPTTAEVQAKKIESARQRGEPFFSPAFLLYSRETGPGKPEAAQYFLLLRDPKKGKAITGDQLQRVTVIDAKGDPGHRAINVSLSEQGGKLLEELTSQNRPTGKNGEFSRQLAILVNGKVMAAPRIRSTVGQNCQISGHYSKAEAEHLVTILRGGAK